eukprot:7391180-Prymnesium_polylepis.1
MVLSSSAPSHRAAAAMAAPARLAQLAPASSSCFSRYQRTNVMARTATAPPHCDARHHSLRWATRCTRKQAEGALMDRASSRLRKARAKSGVEGGCKEWRRRQLQRVA